jgi:uncharacterized protein (DUF1778 family)
MTAYFHEQSYRRVVKAATLADENFAEFIATAALDRANKLLPDATK